MAKVVHCKDVGFDCGYVAKAETEAELMQKVAAHASEVHGLSEVTPEVAEQVRSVIREE